MERFNPMERKQDQEVQEGEGGEAGEFTLEMAKKLASPEAVAKLRKLAGEGEQGYNFYIAEDTNSGGELRIDGEHLLLRLGPFYGTPSHSEQSPRIVFNLDEASPERLVEDLKQLKHGNVIAKELLFLVENIE